MPRTSPMSPSQLPARQQKTRHRKSKRPFQGLTAPGVTETVSGSTAIAQRRGFSKLMDNLESDDILIVTKLYRLGRDAIDVSTTVGALTELGARLYCLALGGDDLTSSAGTTTMNVLNLVAQFERDLLIERTQSGLKRAKSEGKTLGRPTTVE